jgi:hypothetical protein
MKRSMRMAFEQVKRIVLIHCELTSLATFSTTNSTRLMGGEPEGRLQCKPYIAK